MDLEIEILASDKLKAVYNVYQKLKRLFDPLSKFLETLIYVTEIPATRNNFDYKAWTYIRAVYRRLEVFDGYAIWGQERRE
jgi:hypothetical protein